MTSRNRARSALSRADEIEYFLCIGWLSPQCRWQELKDVIRKIPPDGYIRQAYTDHANGTGCGHITILSRKKAFHAYDYLNSNGWKGHSIRLALGIKDENAPNSLLRLRGPEDSLGDSSQRYYPAGHSCPLPTSVLLSLPVSPASVPGNYSYGDTVTYTSQAADPLTPIYRSAMPNAIPSPVPLQLPTPHPIGSYPSSPMPGSQRLVPQSSLSFHTTRQYRQKSSGQQPKKTSGQHPTSKTCEQHPTSKTSGHQPTSKASRQPPTSKTFGQPPTRQTYGQRPSSKTSGQHPTSQTNRQRIFTKIPRQHPISKTSGQNTPSKTSGQHPASKTLTSSPINDGVTSNSNHTNARTVYLYNLPYTTTESAIRELLAPVGQVDRCLVRQDCRRPPRYKLTAVAKFRTPQQAQTAIDRFNRVKWRGLEIMIKLDRGPNAPGPSSGGRDKSSRSCARETLAEARDGPLIVNGSGPSLTCQQRLMDSDDGSSSDEAE